MPKRGEPAGEPQVNKPAAAVGGVKETVKKFPLVEKVKKWFGIIDPELTKHIHQIMERDVEDPDKNKNTVCFVTFSTEGCKEEDAVDDEVNVDMIKRVLFAFHTLPEKVSTGKAWNVEVLQADEQTPNVLCVQEF